MLLSYTNCLCLIPSRKEVEVVVSFLKTLTDSDTTGILLIIILGGVAVVYLGFMWLLGWVGRTMKPSREEELMSLLSDIVVDGVEDAYFKDRITLQEKSWCYTKMRDTLRELRPSNHQEVLKKELRNKRTEAIRSSIGSLFKR